MTGTASQVLWDVLADAYTRPGFDAVGDEAFRSMVLARIIEPASKLATTGILEPDSCHLGVILVVEVQ